MPLITPKEAAAHLGISEDTLKALRKAGEIPYVNIGRGPIRETPRYEVKDLDAWVERRKKFAPVNQGRAGNQRGRNRSIEDDHISEFREALRAFNEKRSKRVDH